MPEPIDKGATGFGVDIGDYAVGGESPRAVGRDRISSSSL
jgi:hypothetical protein